MTPSPLTALAKLRAAGAAGSLGAACAELGIRLLVAHGSAVDAGGSIEPKDLDLAFRGPGADLLAVADRLGEISEFSDIDLMDLDRANPVARARATGPRSEVLYEAAPGVFATEQMAALAMDMETRWLRRLDLELMAGR